METFKMGLSISIIPFSLIFLFITVAWALVDISLRNLSATKKALWSTVVIVLPLVGAVLYNVKVRLPDISNRYKTRMAN